MRSFVSRHCENIFLPSKERMTVHSSSVDMNAVYTKRPEESDLTLEVSKCLFCPLRGWKCFSTLMRLKEVILL